ncbi:MAG TPA: DUF1540 domain-containing protein [Candidatus Omnitrophica bacterium]|nr:DUF1540 domain-containing protein [Candidatus Omnitrophota bacterium]
MSIQMPSILDCNASNCAYNRDEKCHAIAITVGGGACPLCDTSWMSPKKGGMPDVSGGVGACKVESCQFNRSLECGAEGIHIKLHASHADCGTFKKR